jgi:hypothetical protein
LRLGTGKNPVGEESGNLVLASAQAGRAERVGGYEIGGDGGVSGEQGVGVGGEIRLAYYEYAGRTLAEAEFRGVRCVCAYRPSCAFVPSIIGILAMLPLSLCFAGLVTSVTLSGIGLKIKPYASTMFRMIVALAACTQVKLLACLPGQPNAALSLFHGVCACAGVCSET